MSQPPLFVFGTLRRGEWNHHYLAKRFDRVLPAVLPGFRRRGTLMIERGDGGEVAGELFFLVPEKYDETLRECDRLEGIPPGKLVGESYRRILVTVETADGPFEAWCYPAADTPDT